MPETLKKITYRIHGQRKLLVPSIMLRRGYLATAHLGQVESELQAIQGQFSQMIYSYKDEIRHRMQLVPNYDTLTPEELRTNFEKIKNDIRLHINSMNHRLAHLYAMNKNIPKFKVA